MLRALPSSWWSGEACPECPISDLPEWLRSRLSFSTSPAGALIGCCGGASDQQLGEARCPTAARHVVKAHAVTASVLMIDLAFLIMLSGVLGAVALIVAVHPKIERFVRGLYLR